LLTLLLIVGTARAPEFRLGTSLNSGALAVPRQAKNSGAATGS